MVEYAILFIVLSILFIGGAELGMAALASYKNTDAAKTGISEYAEVNQRRLNILNAEKQYLMSLRVNLVSESCASIIGLGNTTTGLDETTDQFKCALENDYQLEFADYVAFLDQIHIDIGLENYALSTPESPRYDDKLIEFDNADSQTLSDDELIEAEISLSGQTASTNKFLKLLLIQHIKLSRLPLDPVMSLSNAKIMIGNHASALIEQPDCNGGIYNDGLPSDRYIYREYYDNTGNKHIFQTGSVVYLFNPLPINTANCQAIAGGISKLVAGYTPPQSSINSVEDFQNNFVTGLPRLNQAMYGMYIQSLNSNLHPPGNLCTHDDCPNEDLIDGAIGPSGYYRWNKGSDGSGVEDLFKYTINNLADELQNGFRPAMQIDCSATPNFRGELGGVFGNINDPACQNGHTKVRLHTRYRKVFEGFLTLGLQELNVPDDQVQDALKLFYNPNQVGVDGSGNIVGSAGSEIGPIGKNRLPTIKPHKDFRGCYEVDVDTNQVSACN